jgi:metal-responsive CopG/Arc/MetJ family transcriptional regulator
MKAMKIATTIDRDVLERLDRLVEQNAFPSRGRIVQEAVNEKLKRLDRRRLARECAKLDAKEEQRFAEAGLA